jgi:signal transduction histidine kinase
VPSLRLRTKLILFAVVIALIPIGIAGRTLIGITEGELKTFTNQEVVLTAEQLAGEIDNLVGNAWLPALVVIRDSIDDPSLGEPEKMGVLRSSINLPDLLALQVTLEGADRPLHIARGDFADVIAKAGYAPDEVLRSTPAELAQLVKGDGVSIGAPSYLDKTDDWLLTVALPLRQTIQGRKATLSAKLDLRRLRERMETHRFTHTGTIRLVDAQGRQIFDAKRADFSQAEPVRTAIGTLQSKMRAAGAMPYTDPSGERMLGGFAAARSVDWAVVVDRSEATAYLAIAEMTKSLRLWVGIGFVVAVVGAVFFAHRVTRPILEIGAVSQSVGEGDFSVRVSHKGSGDEISQLALRINEMIAGLEERERVKSENAVLVELTDRLRSLNEQKNKFLGMAAHDLRNPIGGILGYSELLLEEELGAEERTIVSKIESSSKFMLRLLNDLLDISQIESGKLELNLAACDLGALVQQNVELNRIIASKKQIRIELDTTDDLPAVTLDSGKFEQVLSNLVSNAIKYSFPNTLVRVGVERNDAGVRISVKDQGQGIPEAELPKVFQEFQKTSVQSTAGEKSTGLGLAIVKRIVEGHGGQIGVESTVGEGSTFWFTLPLVPPRAHTAPGAAARRLEQRQPRIDVQLPVAFTYLSPGTVRASMGAGNTVDVSVGGMLLESTVPLKLGDQIKFRFRLDDAAELSGAAIVTRSVTGGRFAMRFSELGGEGDEVLEGYVNRLVKESPEKIVPVLGVTPAEIGAVASGGTANGVPG